MSHVNTNYQAETIFPNSENLSFLSICSRLKLEYLLCENIKTKKRWDFPLGNRPTSCRWLRVTFMGRTSTLPTILHGCKDRKSFGFRQNFSRKSCEKGKSVPRSRTEKGGNLSISPRYALMITALVPT